MRLPAVSVAFLAATVLAGGCGNTATNVLAHGSTKPGTNARTAARDVGAVLARPRHSRLPRCTTFVSARGRSAGSSAGAPTSLVAAISRAAPGSVVCLEAGTYDVNATITLSRSGRPAAPIVYRSYGGSVLLRYTGPSSGSSLGGGILQTSLGPNWGGAHDIVIDGLTLDGADVMAGGIFVTNGAHHVTIQNCVVRNTGSTGIEVNAADYVTVAHNLIYHAGYNQGFSSGVTLWYGGVNRVYGGRTAWYDRAAGFHNVIAGNIVSGTYDNSKDENDGNGIIVDGSGSIPPVLIVNNLVYENGGRGIEINQTSGDIWVVNNTAYADGLDLKVDAGQAAEFDAVFAGNVHFINDLAYGRRDGNRYTTALTYMNVKSTISWAHDIAFNGTLFGIGSISGDPTAYREADPMFTRPPAIPSTRAPWASAVPPWRIGTALMPRPRSRAIGAGIDPTTATGMDRRLAAGLQKYA